LPDETTGGETSRLDAEWIALTAFRGLTKIATNGDMDHSTYNGALEFGGELYPEPTGATVVEYLKLAPPRFPLLINTPKRNEPCVPG